MLNLKKKKKKEKKKLFSAQSAFIFVPGHCIHDETKYFMKEIGAMEMNW